MNFDESKDIKRNRINKGETRASGLCIIIKCRKVLQKFVKGIYKEIYEKEETWQLFNYIVLSTFPRSVFVVKPDRLWKQDRVALSVSQSIEFVTADKNKITKLFSFLRSISSVPFSINFYTSLNDARLILL